MRPLLPTSTPVGAAVALLMAAGAVVHAGDEASHVVDFNRAIRPVLAAHCYRCHGPDADDREGGFRLDQRASAIAVADSGERPVVPGAPEASELLRRVQLPADDPERMPPAAAGPPLAVSTIQRLRGWVRAGAPFARHWAFVAPRHPNLPAVRRTEWCRNAIDRFVLQRLEQAGLEPNPEADRYRLIRRLSFDLRGLPPTPEEVTRFVTDTHSDAYARLVDRMLDDPAYGERWAQMWLDLARYADSRGYGSDPLRPNMWRYRDWVIDALRTNMPYDQFTIEQLAGDLLPNASRGQRMATAFHRNTMTNTEGGTDDEEFRVAAVKDRVDTTFQVWMGLTIGCAKCHDHKYDPITQRDYYRAFAIFNQTADADRPDEAPTLDVPRPADLTAQRVFENKVADLQQQLDRFVEETPRTSSSLRPQIPLEKRRDALQHQLEQLKKKRPKMPTLPVMVELPAKQQRTTHVLVKGNFLQPGEIVEPGIPSQLGTPVPTGTPSRLTLARWLVNSRNPLPARVAVNRFWARVFGGGLVETEEDFGTQCELPSHPMLLDYLATEFMDSGWDVKALLRRIVSSATYRQSARVRPELARRDPRNRLLAHGPRVRLEAEMIRDQALAVSGLLSHKIGGPSVYPYQPPGLWRAAFNGQRKWPLSSGAERYRRALYTFWRRTVPYPSMATFGAPSRELCTLRRPRSNTPLQAFITLNDPVYVEAAQALARRLIKHVATSDAARLAYGLQLCTSRPALPKQVEPLLALLQAARPHFQQHEEAATAVATDPLGAAPAGMSIDELAAWTVVANTMLNLDATLNR